MEPTHASFFSGVGGLDMGLERAGWRTVSFSEIDPYANAVLAERWPGIVNLGDIVRLAKEFEGHDEHPRGRRTDARQYASASDPRWQDATLWTGGFPCQDLSVAGKRRGFGIAHGRRAGQPSVGASVGESSSGSGSRHGPSGPNSADRDYSNDTRSGLAFAFLDLVERHRPPAILLENVPGLLSSHRGRDMAALTGRLAELGYGVAYRILDARHFGVPQRRRRVFIVGLRSDPDDPSGRVAAERAAAVLSVGARCERHPPSGGEAGPGPAARARDGVDDPELVGAIPAGQHGFPDGVQEFMQGHFRVVPGSGSVDGERTGELAGVGDEGGPVPDALGRCRTTRRTSSRASGWTLVGAPPDAGGMRAPHELARRPHDRGELAATLNSGGNDGGFRTEPGEHLIAFDPTTSLDQAPNRDTFPPLKLGSTIKSIGWAPAISGTSGMTADDPMLPLGLDSHRYRCCGNGVVASVAEWVGRQLLTTPVSDDTEGAG